MNLTKKKIYILNISIIFLALLVSKSIGNTEDQEYNWIRFGGKWSITGSSAIENWGISSYWNYYELVNYNTIITSKPVNEYTSIDFSMEIFNPKTKFRRRRPERKKTIDVMASFAVRSPHLKWFFQCVALKLSGNAERVNKISLIYTDRIDKTKKYATKGNFFVKEIISKNHVIEYNTNNRYYIGISNNKAIVLINGEKVLEGTLPGEDYSGRIGFSNRNVQVKIGHVRILNNLEKVFEDNFDTNSIKVPKIGVRRVKRKQKR